MLGLFQRAFRNVCEEAREMAERPQPKVYVVADKYAWKSLFHVAAKKNHRELVDFMRDEMKPGYILGRRDAHMPQDLADWAKAYWRKTGHPWSDRWRREEPTTGTAAGPREGKPLKEGEKPVVEALPEDIHLWTEDHEGKPPKEGGKPVVETRPEDINIWASSPRPAPPARGTGAMKREFKPSMVLYDLPARRQPLEEQSRVLLRAGPGAWMHLYHTALRRGNDSYRVWLRENMFPSVNLRRKPPKVTLEVPSRLAQWAERAWEKDNQEWEKP